MSEEIKLAAARDAGPSGGAGDAGAEPMGGDSPASSGKERLIDVELKRSAVGGTRQSVAYHVLIIVLLVPGVLVAIAALLMLAFLANMVVESFSVGDPYANQVQSIISAFAVLLVIGALVFAGWWHCVSEVRRWRRGGGDPASDESVAGIVRGIMENRWLGMPKTSLRNLLRALVEAGLKHLIVRAYAQDEPLCAEPFETTFGPLPVSEREVGVRQLLDTGAPDAVTTRAAAHRRRNKRRALTQGLALVIGLMLISGMFVHVTGVGGLGAAVVRWAPAIIANVLLSLFLALRAKQNEWLLVPGGVLVRSAGLFRSDWRLHVFDRREAVLLLVQNTLDRWLVLVGDENRQLYHYCTAAEAEALLRAWRAPFEPPRAEQLTDLV